MNKKAALQLSMNFIVTIIIAIVIFGFGVRFVYNILSGSETLKDLTLEQIDNQISELMCSSTEMICLEKDRIEVRPGKVAIIGVKILKNYQDCIMTKFCLGVKTLLRSVNLTDITMISITHNGLGKLPLLDSNTYQR